jgi:hypothetical protein
LRSNDGSSSYLRIYITLKPIHIIRNALFLHLCSPQETWGIE